MRHAIEAVFDLLLVVWRDSLLGTTLRVIFEGCGRHGSFANFKSHRSPN